MGILWPIFFIIAAYQLAVTTYLKYYLYIIAVLITIPMDNHYYLRRLLANLPAVTTSDPAMSKCLAELYLCDYCDITFDSLPKLIVSIIYVLVIKNHYTLVPKAFLAPVFLLSLCCFIRKFNKDRSWNRCVIFWFQNELLEKVVMYIGLKIDCYIFMSFVLKCYVC